MGGKTLTITVPRAESSSQVWVGRGILPTLTSLLDTSRYSKVLVVGDHGARVIVEQVVVALGINPSQALTVQGGEECKSLQHLGDLWDFFATHKLDRRGLVLGVGGGALSDLAGFAAATYMRGVAFAAVPTTLLAQVDASIGGKSGINVRGIKNLVGAITQPIGIIIDTEVLKTLPEREIRSGFAEIVKHGLIADRDYFELVTSCDCMSWQHDDMVDIIFRSCEIKCAIVGQDASEQGIRKALNFGHTLGHAVEALALREHIPLTHGESVAIGMNAACFISHAVGLLSEPEWHMSMSGIKRVGLPLTLPRSMDQQKLLELLSLDKKNIGGLPQWTLVNAIGSVIVNQSVAPDIVHRAISHIQPQ